MLETTTQEVAITAEGTLLEVLRVVDVKNPVVPVRLRIREGKESIEMIRVTVEIGEGSLTHRTQVTAPSIERALKIAGGKKPARRVRLTFPIEPEAFFVTEVPGRKEAA